jgi:thiamine-phosphate pyrophosphorylase
MTPSPSLRPLSACQFYAFVDTGYLGGRDPLTVAEQLCEGGADIIQFRAKYSAPAEVSAQTHRLLGVTQPAGVWLVVNDYPEIAAQSGAPLCHLGQEDFFGAGHRLVADVIPAGSGLMVGLSTHTPDQAARAVAAGAHYIAVGPVFPTPTKPAAPPVTLHYVRWAARHVQVPWFAIGGINLRNLDEVLAAGARRICVVSAILGADDVVGACRAFKRRLEAARTPQAAGRSAS